MRRLAGGARCTITPMASVKGRFGLLIFSGHGITLEKRNVVDGNARAGARARAALMAA
jgi:hypothetical protein